MEVVIPQSFLDMPRWWHEGSDWLAGLPQRIRTQCQKWDLRIAGGLAHGSNAVVVPVVSGTEEFVLRMCPAGNEVADQVAALQFWDGRGTVQLFAADVTEGAMLLERLEMGHSLDQVPVSEAVAVLGRTMRRLAVPAPAHVPTTAAVVDARSRQLESDWHRLGRPFPGDWLTAALDAAVVLRVTTSDLAVDGDLHSGQVLRGCREPWLTIDPALLRGDIDYDLARVL